MAMSSLAALLGRPIVADAFLAVILALWSLAELAGGAVVGPLLVAVPGAAAMSVPFLFRRRFPIVAPVVVVLAFLVQSILGVDPDSVPSVILAVFAAGYTVGSCPRLALSAPVGAVLAVLAALSVPTIGNAGFAVLVVGGGWVVGRLLLLQRTEAARVQAAAREREVRAATAVLQERARIAREMHDVVAHAVGVMVVQASAAEEVLGGDPAAARRPLSLIQDAGRQALGELRGLLDVLREDDDGSSRSPQPGLADLSDLVARVRGAGLPVTLEAAVPVMAVAPNVGLTAYRLVQEALTNVLKHSRQGEAVVDFAVVAGNLEVSVRNTGRSVPGGVGGHGLAGMRERVASCGGALEAGPVPEGGFLVRARLPLGEAGT